MFIHTVYFWLKPDRTPEQCEAFRKGVESLQHVETLRFFHVGVPAETTRPVIDRSYTVALVVGFENQSGHDIYQVHPLHLAFVEQFNEQWERVLIYDSE